MTHLPSVSDTQTMKCSHSNVNNLLALQTLNQLRFSYMSICPMAKAKVVSLSPVNQDVNAYKLIILNFEKIYHNYAPVIHISMLCEFISHILLTSIEEKNTYSPCPHLPRLGQCQGELCPTFNLYHTLTTQSFYSMWNAATFTTSSPQLAKISISPAVHQATVGQC